MKKKSIISIDNLDAIEVMENNRLAPRYGMDQLSFRSTRIKEQKVLRECEKILETKELPLLMLRLEEFGIEGVQDETQDIFAVLEKTVELLKQGFHVLIIRSMMGCAGGNKSSLGYGLFDEKFSRALTDMDFRKELWGTEKLFPIDVVRFFLLDLMNDINFDAPCEEDIEKSELVSDCRLHYSGKECQESECKLSSGKVIPNERELCLLSVDQLITDYTEQELSELSGVALFHRGEGIQWEDLARRIDVALDEKQGVMY